MIKILSSIPILLILATSFIWAQSEVPPWTSDRKVVSMPEVQPPPEAIQSGLKGVVRVSVTVDAEGNVVRVGTVSGPGSVCSQVSRPDVVAMRSTGAEAARSVKFAPVQEGQPPLVWTWVNIDFGGGETTETIATEPNSVNKPKDPKKYTVIGDKNYSAANVPPPDYKGPVVASKEDQKLAEKPKYTVVPDKEYSAASPSIRDSPGPAKTISGGVLNGKAISLPKPPYPPAARAVQASGAVSIQVLIDTDGKVFSAEAVSGHPLLRTASVIAACGSEFTPTLLVGEPVKVFGVITYNFVP